MAKLVLANGDETIEHELGTLTTVGRHSDNTIPIRHHTLSKKHARILRRDDGDFEVHDLDSANGTFLNARRVTIETLHHEDSLFFGEFQCTFLDPRQADRPRRRITITPSLADSGIMQRTQAMPTGSFPLESELGDEGVLRSHYEQLRIAFDVGRVLSAALDERGLLEALLDEVFNRVAISHAVILLREEGKRELTPKFTKNRPGYPDRFVLLGSAIDQVIENKKTVITEADTLSVCVPIMEDTTMLGALHARFSESAEEIGEGPVHALEAACSAAGIYLETLRATRRLEVVSRRRSLLRRFLPRKSAEALTRDEKSLKRMDRGELKDVTIMCAEISGFDDMARTRPGRDSLVRLNKTLGGIIECLFSAGATLGHVDLDQVVAMFGAPQAMEDATGRACSAAFEILQVEAEHRQDDDPQTVMRVGVATGPALVGFTGPGYARRYSAFGRAASFAADLCRDAPPGGIRIDSATRGRLPQRFRVEATTSPNADIQTYVVTEES